MSYSGLQKGSHSGILIGSYVKYARWACNLVVLNTYNGAIEDYRTIRFDPEGALLFSQSARP